MKKLWIIANFKSNKNVAEVLDWVSLVGPKLQISENIKVGVCPTFTALGETRKAVKIGNFPLLVGSQDLSPFGLGSYTGEEPAEILKEMIDFALIGHSERRQNFSETDETVASKVKQAEANGILSLVCVQGAETPIPPGAKIIAYEPVFAIGTGIPDIPENAEKVAKTLKEIGGDGTEVLYGGSVNSENCKNFTSQDNINGLLIGKSSLDAEEFVKIVENCTASAT